MEELQVQIDRLLLKLAGIKDFDAGQALIRACFVVENSARVNCPVDVGQLRNSITHEVEENSGYVGTNVEYAPYVEYGTGLFASDGNGRQTPWSYQDAKGQWHTTSGQKPNPFLHRALTENKDEVNRIFVEAVQQQIKKVGNTND